MSMIHPHPVLDPNAQAKRASSSNSEIKFMPRQPMALLPRDGHPRGESSEFTLPQIERPPSISLSAEQWRRTFEWNQAGLMNSFASGQRGTIVGSTFRCSATISAGECLSQSDKFIS